MPSGANRTGSEDDTGQSAFAALFFETGSNCVVLTGRELAL